MAVPSCAVKSEGAAIPCSSCSMFLESWETSQLCLRVSTISDWLHCRGQPLWWAIWSFKQGSPSIFVPSWMWCHQQPHRKPASKITVICIWWAIKCSCPTVELSYDFTAANRRPGGLLMHSPLAELHQGMNYWVLCRSELHSDRERGRGHSIEQKEIGKSGKQDSGSEKPRLCLNKGKAKDKESRDHDISRAAEYTQEPAAFAFGWIKGVTWGIWVVPALVSLLFCTLSLFLWSTTPPSLPKPKLN